MALFVLSVVLMVVVVGGLAGWAFRAEKRRVRRPWASREEETVPAGGWDTAPGCVQQHVPGSEGVFKPYEKCADFFTFGHGSKINTFA